MKNIIEKAAQICEDLIPSTQDMLSTQIGDALQAAADKIRALAAAPPSKQFTPQQAANLKAAFAEEGIPWPNVNLNSKDTHLAELLQQCIDAFEEDGGDLDHASRILGHTREVLQWRLRGADGERPARGGN